MPNWTAQLPWQILGMSDTLAWVTIWHEWPSGMSDHLEWITPWHKWQPGMTDIWHEWPTGIYDTLAWVIIWYEGATASLTLVAGLTGPTTCQVWPLHLVYKTTAHERWPATSRNVVKVVPQNKFYHTVLSSCLDTKYNSWAQNHMCVSFNAAKSLVRCEFVFFLRLGWWSLARGRESLWDRDNELNLSSKPADLPLSGDQRLCPIGAS